MQKAKTLSATIILFIVFGVIACCLCCLVSLARNEGVAVKNNAENLSEELKRNVIASLSEHEVKYEEIAQALMHCSDGRSLYFYFETKNGNLSEELTQNIMKFNIECDMDLQCVYIGGQTQHIYPENACVFRRVVMDDDEVYCWIDLVYSENWDSYLNLNSSLLEQEVITYISPNWYVVQLYGF